MPVIAARGGKELVGRLFEPLGYAVEVKSSSLDESFLEWDASPYVALTISGTTRLQDMLTHLYVLIPVLDNEKHYWVVANETEKLLRRGEGWLGSHPAFTGARLVKGFNHLPATQLGTSSASSKEPQVAFVSSNDADASAAIAKIAGQLGFAPVELGRLDQGGVPLHIVNERPGGLVFQNLAKLAN